MNSLQVLIDARKLIEKPENWGWGSYAKDAAGEPISPHSPSAYRFCSIGALDRAAGGREHEGYWQARIQLEVANNINNIIPWNDAHVRTHAEILAAFDRAIEAERTRAQTSAQASGAA